MTNTNSKSLAVTEFSSTEYADIAQYIFNHKAQTQLFQVEIISVNRNGDYRTMDIELVRGKSIININDFICEVAGYTMNNKGYLIARGGGMDMAFKVLYDLLRTLTGEDINSECSYNRSLQYIYISR